MLPSSSFITCANTWPFDIRTVCLCAGYGAVICRRFVLSEKYITVSFVYRVSGAAIGEMDVGATSVVTLSYVSPTVWGRLAKMQSRFVLNFFKVLMLSCWLF